MDRRGCSASSKVSDEQAKATLQFGLEEWEKIAGNRIAREESPTQWFSQKEVDRPDPTFTEVADRKKGRHARRSFQTMESSRWESPKS